MVVVTRSQCHGIYLDNRFPNLIQIQKRNNESFWIDRCKVVLAKDLVLYVTPSQNGLKYEASFSDCRKGKVDHQMIAEWLTKFAPRGGTVTHLATEIRDYKC